jgi:hypothetical protein
MVQNKGTAISEDLATSIIMAGNDTVYKWMRLDCYSLSLKLAKGEVKGGQKGRETQSYSSHHSLIWDYEYSLATCIHHSTAILDHILVHTK